MQQAIEHGADGGHIAEQFAPVFHRTIRSQCGFRLRRTMFPKEAEHRSWFKPNTIGAKRRWLSDCA
jgi:hypothetical protein